MQQVAVEPLCCVIKHPGKYLNAVDGEKARHLLLHQQQKLIDTEIKTESCSLRLTRNRRITSYTVCTVHILKVKLRNVGQN
jgi:hypothetical protein